MMVAVVMVAVVTVMREMAALENLHLLAPHHCMHQRRPLCVDLPAKTRCIQRPHWRARGSFCGHRASPLME